MTDIWRAFLHIRSDVFYVFGLLMAASVTAHVLLRKREVTSAVGWIGLAWFAPVFGSIVYVLFGVNRVQRRARKLRPQDARRGRRTSPAHPGDDGHLDALKRGIGRITARPLLGGNTVKVFQDGDQAYPVMLAAIAEAKSSVALSSYIFRGDEWGGKFVDALAEAHGRGIAVRVIIDGIGGGWLRAPAFRHLRRRGVPAIRFLHSLLPWRMPFLNLRSHKKILVIDGAIGFTGGMNIADENVMATNPPNPVQDTHFRIEGPVVCQLMEAFVQDWSFATDEDLSGEAWFPDIAECGPTPARVIDSGPDEDLEKIEFAMLEAVACARETVAIMTPYFLPNERLINALSLAVMRGVAVDIVVPQTSDHVFIDWASRPNNAPLLAEGVKIWRCPPPFRHTKIMLVDREWAIIGSCNWDMRSFRLNFEICTEFFDPDLGAVLEDIMAPSRRNPLTLDEINARPLPTQLRDAAIRLLLPYL